MVYNIKNFIKKDSSLFIQGNVFIMKDGRVVLYLGRGKTFYSDIYYFYILGAVHLSRCENSNDYYDRVLSNMPYQEIFLTKMINIILSNKLSLSCIHSLKTFPDLIGVVTSACIKDFKSWYIKQRFVQPELPDIDFTELVKTDKIHYVRADKLESGRIYRDDDGIKFLYLGMMQTSYFYWLCISHPDVKSLFTNLLSTVDNENLVCSLLQRFSRNENVVIKTKKNKHVVLDTEEPFADFKAYLYNLYIN